MTKNWNQGVPALNSILRERVNFRRRPILCTALYRNPIKASNFGGTFDQLFFWIFLMQFSQIFPLLFYTMVQKSQKMTKKSNQEGGGSYLNSWRAWSPSKFSFQSFLCSLVLLCPSLLNDWQTRFTWPSCYPSTTQLIGLSHSKTNAIT